MYCKYCGKLIDDDSIYCRYCGKDVTANGHNLTTISTDIKLSSFTEKIKYKERKERCINYLKPKLIFSWKVLKTVVFAIGGLFAWIVVGFIYAPFIALFNADIPKLGIFEEIEKIWKKEEKPKEEEKPLEDYFDF
ncbi:zinc-ribbon domain-containing protein [Prevotellamassilia timonensis]|uniref:zinc-ribbon domain-containing protein n=1 Tax=Prevotellamassilia timonensis TaxID=1852370 RepID=UPI001F352278|nr:zinc-ribbon domain-containing protein [Prevotellamassilia timonensis]MCF2635105.1 zinc ribbon domain-containing protein [Prevotellamassilia timonensis]